MTDKEIISNYMRGLAEKSHQAVKLKYGVGHYKNMSDKGLAKRWGKNTVDNVVLK